MASRVSDLQEFIGAINEICSRWHALSTTTHPWFRGQGNLGWPLLPRLYRSDENSLYERELCRDFRLRATAFIESVPTHELEWLFVMQHHGMPTRLLDWTESHLCALYFAVLDYRSTKDAVVWVLDPWSLNHFSMGWRSVPASTNKLLDSYVLKSDEDAVVRHVEADKPVAVRPSRSTKRIVAQRGTFTVHGRSTINLEILQKSIGSDPAQPKIRLASVPINGRKKKAILKELLLAGISHSTMFPDLDGLSREIHFRYSKAYLV